MLGSIRSDFIINWASGLSPSQGLSDKATSFLSGRHRSVPPSQNENDLYLSLLHQKNEAIDAEINKLENGIVKGINDSAQYHDVVEHSNTLRHQIQDLKAQIADYALLESLPFEDTTMKEISKKYRVLKKKNDEEVKKNNYIFSGRSEIQENIEKIQRKKEIIKDGLQSMSRENQKEFVAMMTENEDLLDKIDAFEEERKQIFQSIETYESELQQDNDKLEIFELYKELMTKQEDLEQMMKKPSGCPEAASQKEEYLIKKIERDLEEIGDFEEQLIYLEDKEREMAKRFQCSQDSQMENKILKRREKKLDRLLALLENSRAEEQENIHHTKEDMASISKHLKRRIRRCCRDGETVGNVEKLMELLDQDQSKVPSGSKQSRVTSIKTERFDFSS